MKHPLAAFLLCLSSALAQIPMAANADGSTFLFANNLVLKGEPLALAPTRIFRHAETPIVQPYSLPDSRVIHAPFLSSDSQTTGYFVFYPCAGSCTLALPRNLLILHRQGKERFFQAYFLNVSPNGRFVIANNMGLRPTTIEDLDTGTGINVPGVTSVANDGTALVLNSEGLRLAPFGGPSRLLLNISGVREALFSASGAFAFVQTSTRLIAIDTATGDAQGILDGLPENVSMSLSSQGRLLLHRDRELLLWDRSLGWRSLFSHEEGFSMALLTGNGDTVFAKTATNRIYRIDANSGESAQLYAPFPSRLSSLAGSTYPGSLFRYGTDYSGDELEIRLDETRYPKLTSRNLVISTSRSPGKQRTDGTEPIDRSPISGFPVFAPYPHHFRKSAEPRAFSRLSLESHHCDESVLLAVHHALKPCTRW